MNNVETLCCVTAHPRRGRRLVRRASAPRQSAGHQAAEHLRRLQQARRLRGPVRHHRCGEVLETGRRRATPWPCRSAGPAGR
ncbi:MAG: hypothetical protein MZU79_06535 [Anaerotruncus sp.]|nr:hypothetical protein [Anaerotruncus sp.]